MTDPRSRNSAKARKICFESHRHDGPLGKERYLTCHVNKCLIDTLNKKQPWRADHIIPWAIGGEDTAKNLLPICLACDGGIDGKAANDTTVIAKGKRVSVKHFGLEQKKGPVMPGSKRSKFKKLFSGEVVIRK